MSDHITFAAPLETRLRDGHTFVVVENIRDCHDFAWLEGARVVIAGHPYKVLGVEKFLHSPPWIKGETIGLLIDPA